ncbi:MAG: sugar ABC transporter permease [Nitrososphaeria archaeon]|nr:sugar ABC transporter permease [Nitrososphaeria archaeon]
MKDSTFGFLVALPGTLYILVLVAFPLGLLFWLSFVRFDFYNPIVFIGLQNYYRVIEDRVFWLALQNTVTYALGVTVVTTLLGILMAAAVSRISRFSTLFRTLLILPWAVPLVVSGLVWRWMLDPGVGIYNYLLISSGLVGNVINIFGDPTLAMITCILADSWTRIPFTFILVLAGIQSISVDLYEAARVDGANMIHTFRNITLPLSQKSILTAVLFNSMFSFRTIDVIWSMTRGGPGKATYVLGMQLVDYLIMYLNLGVSAALGVIMLILVATFTTVIIYHLLRR